DTHCTGSIAPISQPMAYSIALLPGVAFFQKWKPVTGCPADKGLQLAFGAGDSFNIVCRTHLLFIQIQMQFAMVANRVALHAPLGKQLQSGTASQFNQAWVNDCMNIGFL